MKKEVEVKVKVGDRICIVNPVDTFGEYVAGDEGVVTSVAMDMSGVIGVDVQFDHYEGVSSMYVYLEEFKVIDPRHDDHLSQMNGEMSKTAESLRNSILDIRYKREALQKEILQLEDQEKEAVEKLKEQGFVLYEDNASKELDVKELVATEIKPVLCAEDIGEDMTDPANWEAGDLFVRREGDGTDGFEVGDNIRLIDKDGEDEFYFKYEYLDESDYWYVEAKNVKFHSRPVK